MVELDVHRCKSGEIVVIHDLKVDRTTNGKGAVRKKTFEELRTLDAGSGEKIPTLQEVLDLLDKKVHVNIELKGRNTVAPVVRIIRKYIKEEGWTCEQFIVSSLTRHHVKKAAKLKSPIRIGALLAYRTIRFLKYAKAVNAFSVHVSRKIVNKKFVEDAHQLGFKVYVWTVNEPDEIKWVKSIGVDGIFSDFPDRI